jgi:hypothetical protein
MDSLLGMDLGSNSLGWALVDTNKMDLRPENRSAQRANYRQARRIKQRFHLRMSFHFLKEQFPNSLQPKQALDFIKWIFPVFINVLPATLFIGSLIMVLTQSKDFQFCFNLAITVLLGWIALKKQ